MGNEGWELVSMVVAEYNWTKADTLGSSPVGVVTQWQSSQYRVVFKRRKL
jgi:hypothetical protein